MKNVQISQELFVALLHYHLSGENEYEEVIEQGLEQKLDAMLRHELYAPVSYTHLFVAVHGKGDPNDPAGEYKAALELLYGMAFTIKMSYKGRHKMNGYFEYVVPPLEGLRCV